MFHNYFYLKRLAAALDDRLRDRSLAQCFSQNKDELILQFDSSEDSFYIRAQLDPTLSLLQFPISYARAGKNSVDLFTSLIGHTVSSVQVHRYERSFSIYFGENILLLFKLHGRRSNILLVKHDQVEALFRNTLQQDLEIRPDELHNNVSISEATLAEYHYNANEMLPAIGREGKMYLKNNGYETATPVEKWSLFQKLLTALETNPITLVDSAVPAISLLKTSDSQMNSAVDAANWLYEQTVRKVVIDHDKEKVIQQLKQRVRKSENYILKTQDKLDQVLKARSPEEEANILMANLHQLHQGMKHAVLADFYTDAPITIKLNEKLSPQKNAENLYRKSKNRHKEIAILKGNIAGKHLLIEKLSKMILEVMELETHKELKAFKKKYKLAQAPKKTEHPLPYHAYELDGWKILVGKNSQANDELSLKVAHKNDLWLHAKDVAGSHVVVRQRAGQNFPTHVIEYAAGLAAANSKRKTDTLCPVIYTPKKYIRKLKGAPAGQVIVEKEEVVMIEPANK